MKERALKKTVRTIQSAMVEDSGFSPDEGELRAVVEKDRSTNGGVLPTEKECEILVMGGDDGQVPEDLKRRFPNTDRYLNSLF